MIYFDKVISDYTENNDSSYLYAFSTGPQMDSLRFSGQVVNAFSKQPSQDYIVGVYPDTTTNFSNVIPMYISRTSKEGKFEVPYIKPGSYKLAAFQDGDGDRVFSMTSEDFGYISNPVSLPDTTLGDIFITTSKSKRPGYFIKSFEWDDELKIITNEAENNLRITPVQKIVQTHLRPTILPDSFMVEVNLDTLKSAKLIVQGTQFTDTITVTRPSLPSLKLTSKGSSNSDTITIKSNSWITEVNTDKIQILKDSAALPFTKVKSNNRNAVALYVPGFDSLQSAQIIFDSAAVKNNYDVSNDSTALNINYKKTSYGTIELSFKNRRNNLILLIYDGQTLVKYIQTSQDKIVLDDIPEGSYSLRAVIDSNKNGIWDPYIKETNEQPEKVIDFNQQIQVKAGWTSEIVWKIK